MDPRRDPTTSLQDELIRRLDELGEGHSKLDEYAHGSTSTCPVCQYNKAIDDAISLVREVYKNHEDNHTL